MKRKTLTVLLTVVAAGIFVAGRTPLADEVLPDAVTDRDYHNNATPPDAQVELGRMLFFDKILSGNRNIACATCHHPKHATTDAVALPLGEGARGLGPERKPGMTKEESVHGRVPRNSPALFNLGATEFTRMFHDGRVEADPDGYYEGGFITPAKWKLPKGLDNPLAAQAMFPVTSPAEMAGQKGENSVADAISLNRAAGPTGAWELLSQRLRAIPEYVKLFREAYPDQVKSEGDISFVLVANAIAAFEAKAFRADDSPFDRYLRGETAALSKQQKRGMDLFYGKAQCSSCHSGKFQTDHNFYAIAIPQIGPGKGDGRHADYWRVSGHETFLEDFGRGRVTVRPEDNFKFRTPSLRNVELTGPWGHDGAYRTLEEVVLHHLDPIKCLNEYNPDPGDLPELGRVLELTASGSRLSQEWLSEARLSGFMMRDTFVHSNSALRKRIADANQLDTVELTNQEVDDLVVFLSALTDPSSRDLTDVIPDRVPSGLPVQD